MAMSTRKVQTFEITGRSDAAEYEKLVNDPNVVVSSSNDFFAPMPSDDGMVTVITRVVDYREMPKSDTEVYQAPIS